jgi:hypothetical protein
MMKKGRPFEPGNKFGCGRPRGSRNKKSLAAQQLLDSHAESVVRKALVEAMKGDAPLLRTLLGHILPRRRDAPVKTGPLPVHTAEELGFHSRAKRCASAICRGVILAATTSRADKYALRSPSAEAEVAKAIHP